MEEESPEEEESDDDDEGGDETDRHVHESSFHVWGTDYWDLPVKEPDGDDVDIVSEEDRLTMDSLGRASVWKDLEGVQKKKKWS